jgi:hypothetical protein
MMKVKGLLFALRAFYSVLSDSKNNEFERRGELPWLGN